MEFKFIKNDNFLGNLISKEFFNFLIKEIENNNNEDLILTILNLLIPLSYSYEIKLKKLFQKFEFLNIIINFLNNLNFKIIKKLLKILINFLYQETFLIKNYLNNNILEILINIYNNNNFEIKKLIIFLLLNFSNLINSKEEFLIIYNNFNNNLILNFYHYLNDNELLEFIINFGNIFFKFTLIFNNEELINNIINEELINLINELINKKEINIYIEKIENFIKKKNIILF